MNKKIKKTTSSSAKSTHAPTASDSISTKAAVSSAASDTAKNAAVSANSEKSPAPDGNSDAAGAAESSDQPKTAGFCTSCGKSYPHGCLFCTACGSPIKNTDDIPQAANEILSADTQQNSDTRPSTAVPEASGAAPASDTRLQDDTVQQTENTRQRTDNSSAEVPKEVPIPEAAASGEADGETYGTVSSKQRGTADYCTCCGKVVTVNCTYCPVCGVRLTHTDDSEASSSISMPNLGNPEIAELTLCEYCGSVIPFGSLACSGCGAGLYGGGSSKEARVCPCCGKAVAATCMYCPVCGDSLSSKESGRKAFAAGLPEWNLEPKFAAQNVRLPKAKKG